jgi:hypothetical protein
MIPAKGTLISEDAPNVIIMHNKDSTLLTARALDTRPGN